MSSRSRRGGGGGGRRGGKENGGDGGWDKGLLWKLPSLNDKRLGKLGPAFGIGAGCGLGLGLGLMGGAGIGAGIPGLQFGFGVGAGCGVGIGFGYGAGRGIAYDEKQQYSNIGKQFSGAGSIVSHEEVDALLDELVMTTRKLIRAASKEVDKWRR